MKEQTKNLVDRLRKHQAGKNPKTVTETAQIEGMTRQAVEYFNRRYDIVPKVKGQPGNYITDEQKIILKRTLKGEPGLSYRQVGEKCGVSYTTARNWAIEWGLDK